MYDCTKCIDAGPSQADFDTFRQTSEQMLEAKDFQLQQSLETNAELRSQSSTLRRELVSSPS